MAFAVEYHPLSLTDATSRTISLAGVPLSAANVAMDLIGGTAQAMTDDFAVDGTRIRWDSSTYRLYYTPPSIGDNIRIIYDRS